DHPTDSTATYILNESAVKALGWETAAGKSFKDGKVIGVVKDFHFQPFKLAIEPMFITFHNQWTTRYAGNIAMKVDMKNADETIAHIQQTIKAVLPEVPFDINYMDDAYNQLYQSEQRFSAAFNFFTFIALFIACIGLFGLVTHHVLLRTKEIGIRKVLGASVTNIVGLIAKDFMKLILFAALVAAPIAWWAMSTWLADFAYRIELNWWVFAVAAVVAIMIAFLTVSSQSLRAALANPIEAIRSE
ncbi:MAG: ABC transporter permease, partial [Saprospiraceae bacterium]